MSLRCCHVTKRGIKNGPKTMCEKVIERECVTRGKRGKEREPLLRVYY